MAIKLILDTDIGTDVDDAWALALCLACEEIGLIGVTLVHADLETRARIALKTLKLAGRLDVPVYKGLSKPITDGAAEFWGGHEGSETDFSDIEGLAARDGAVEFIIEAVERWPGEVVVCPIGPLTNIGEAIRQAPDSMRKMRKLAIMGTTYGGEGRENAAREHNGCVDPLATKLVLESGISATVVGLNVTTRVAVRRADLSAVAGSAFGDYLAAMTCQQYDLIGRDSTWMHDPLAVAGIVDPSLLTTKPMRAEVMDDGRVAYFAADSGLLDVSVDVDARRFENMLLSRLSRMPS